MIEIPYWWDGKASSLQATINSYLPQVIPQGDGVIIPTEPPVRTQRVRAVPFVLDVLEHPSCYWQDNIDPTGWYLTQQVTGLRAYWDGFGAMWLVTGKRVELPTRIAEMLPKEPLDGVLV